jgi:two-component system, NtrC family, response regulator AtoC
VCSGVEQAVQAMRAGAAEVVEHPLSEEALLFALERANERRNVEADEPPPSQTSTRPLLGPSRPIQKVLEMVDRAAAGTATVLIRGESGTGKELVARAVHEKSRRRLQPFIKLHCAALPDTLLESELFGYEKGAFTGATSRKPGRVEAAEGGTLFLDEIGDITPAMQVKLLRLLQEREYERLGSTETRKADVRFVAATHRDLETLVRKGEFREDLFYRLNVVPLWMPPLRARREDIEPLALHFCQEFARANGRADVRLGECALRVLRHHRWPGNVRQLQNFIERLVVMSDEDLIDEAQVTAELDPQRPFSTVAPASVLRVTTSGPASAGPPQPLSQEVREAERRALLRALKHTKGNRTLAARVLGVSRATLYNKLAEHGLGDGPPGTGASQAPTS